jgi:shikimate kinase
LLAERTGWRYVDNDDAVRTLTDRDPTDIIAAGGEQSLHDAEAAALLQALGVDEPAIIGAAAWVVLQPDCQAALRLEPNVVYLRARPETLRGRIGGGAGRRTDATDLAWLEQRTRERDELYQGLATLTVDVDERSPDEVADLVLSRFSRGH